MNKKNENLMIFSWVVAFAATLGSLYFSEIRLYEPCKLCWVQRIFMYPIAIILLIGVILKDSKAFVYSTVFAGIGFLVSTYHYGLQKLPFLQESSPSCGRVSCTAGYIDWAGFITIPFLAMTAFLIILIISIAGWKHSKEV
ncbi:disulfide bond formation protein B [Halalkalibacillus sediminis]|uniref:Probable disulfide formation protein n=1 Tax=Halalkalibacillus sediminis TaxID=2018042 RepID=A0A2I0QRV6_9BACI|nr:disulfide oxidoreductase [Halalkalibacillus sediminis]PKR77063.1 disulfide bond formation protein B [Halalkalibacillus sediminis]